MTLRSRRQSRNLRYQGHHHTQATPVIRRRSQPIASVARGISDSMIHILVNPILQVSNPRRLLRSNLNRSHNRHNVHNTMKEPRANPTAQTRRSLIQSRLHNSLYNKRINRVNIQPHIISRNIAPRPRTHNHAKVNDR